MVSGGRRPLVVSAQKELRTSELRFGVSHYALRLPTLDASWRLRLVAYHESSGLD
jgi:hypothetical protein